jgi:hypothetical protein
MMNHSFKFVVVALVMALGLSSPVLARSHSSRTCACSNPRTALWNYEVPAGGVGLYAYVSPYYDYVPGVGVQPYFPSAAALGNSH